MAQSIVTHTTRYVDGAWDVIRVSDGAVMQTYDTPALAAEHAARLSTRAAIELAAEMDEQAADTLATHERFAAEGAVIAARAEFERAEREYDAAGDEYERLWAAGWVTEALGAMEEAEQRLTSLEAVPVSYPLAVRCSAPGVRVVPDALPDTARLVWRWQGTADELRAEIERRRAAYWERSERLKKGAA